MTTNNISQWAFKLETCLKKSLLEERAHKESFSDQNENENLLKQKLLKFLNKILKLNFKSNKSVK